MQKKKSAIIAAALCVVLCVGVATAYKAIAAKSEVPPTNRREYKVNRGDITVGVDGAGTAAVDKILQHSTVDGKIDKILVKAGQAVKKGDILATLSEDSLKEKQKAAEAALKKGGIALEQAQIAKRQADIGVEGTFNKLVDNISNTKNDYTASCARQNEAIALLSARLDELAAQLDALKAQLAAANEADKAAIQAQIAEKQKKYDETLTSRDGEKAKLEGIVKDYSAAEGAWQNDAKYAGETKDLAIKNSELSLRLAQMDYGNLKKAADEAKKALEDLNIYASCDGIVLAVDAKEGAEITKGTPIATVGDMGKRSLQVLVPQTEIFKIKQGQEAELYFEAHPDNAIYGHVESISFIPENANNAVNYKVVIRLPDTELAIYEGMTAEAVFIIKRKEDVLMLSNKAISFEDGKQYVIKKGSDGADVKTQVETGFSDGKVTEIKSGLSQNDIAFAERK